MIPPEELRHLDSGPRHGEQLGGAGTVELVAKCPGGAERMLARCREVLRAVIAEKRDGRWPTPEEWEAILPGWFVQASSMSQSEEKREHWLRWWRGLPPDGRAQAAAEQPWSLNDWLFWFQHDDRAWYWWDGVVDDGDTVRICVEVTGWPVPLGALEWLLRASGAIQIRCPETI